MKRSIAYVLAATCLLTSCAKNEKKILLLVRGKVTVDEAAKKVTIKEALGNDEKELNYDSKEKVTLAIESFDKQTSIDIPENGYYIVNAKNDTLIGGVPSYGAQKESGKVLFTQEMIKKSIDSLTALTEGKNLGTKGFYIMPYTATKITANTNAIIISPYHQMTSITKEEGKEVEVYRFYSIKEIRDKIAKQVELTKKPSADKK